MRNRYFIPLIACLLTATSLLFSGHALHAQAPQYLLVTDLGDYDPTDPLGLGGGPFSSGDDIPPSVIGTLRYAMSIANGDPAQYYIIQFKDGLQGSITLVADLFSELGNVRIEGDQRITLARNNYCVEFGAQYSLQLAENLSVAAGTGKIEEKRFELDGIRIGKGLVIIGQDEVVLSNCIIGPGQEYWNFSDIDLISSSPETLQARNEYAPTSSETLGENPPPPPIFTYDNPALFGDDITIRPPEDFDACELASGVVTLHLDQVLNFRMERTIFTDFLTRTNVGPSPGNIVGYIVDYPSYFNAEYNTIQTCIFYQPRFEYQNFYRSSPPYWSNPTVNGSFEFTDSYIDANHIRFLTDHIRHINSFFNYRTDDLFDSNNTLHTSHAAFNSNHNYYYTDGYGSPAYASDDVTFDNYASDIVIKCNKTIAQIEQETSEQSYVQLFNINSASEIIYEEVKKELRITFPATNQYYSQYGLGTSDVVEIEVYRSDRIGQYLESLQQLSQTIVQGTVNGQSANYLRVPFEENEVNWVRAIITHNGRCLFETLPFELPLCREPINQQAYIEPNLNWLQKWKPTDNISFSKTGMTVPALRSGATEYTVDLKLAPAIMINGVLSPDKNNTIKKSKAYPTFPLSGGTLSTTSLITRNLYGKYFVSVGLHYGEEDYAFVWSDPVLIQIGNTSTIGLEIPLDGYSDDFLQEHEDKINWEYTVNYFDNDKTTETMVFADGLGQVRQNQVKNNTSDQVIVTESAYGVEGAAVINSLPAPVPGNQFAYRPDFFDVSIAGEERDFRSFYVDRKTQDGSLISPPAIVNKVGSVGRYYSAQGEESAVGSANGFPYVYAISEANPEGRVLRESSGVGIEHLASGDHANRYYYLQANQSELDRLFGIDAPVAKSVSKEIVYDPNGIGTLSYKDLNGNTIATGVTAMAPNEEMNEFQPKTTNDPVISVEDGENGIAEFRAVVDVVNEGEGTINYNALNKKVIKTFHVPGEDVEVDIDYTPPVGAFEFEFADNTHCINCNYEIIITVKKQRSGEEVYRFTDTYIPSQDICDGSNPGYQGFQETITLDGPEDYLVERFLQMVDKDGLPDVSAVWEENFEELTVDTSYQKFLEEEGYQGYYVMRKTRTRTTWTPEDEDIPDFDETPYVSIFAGGGSYWELPTHRLEWLLTEPKNMVYSEGFRRNSEVAPPEGMEDMLDVEKKLVILTTDGLYESVDQAGDQMDVITESSLINTIQDMAMAQSGNSDLLLKINMNNSTDLSPDFAFLEYFAPGFDLDYGIAYEPEIKYRKGDMVYSEAQLTTMIDVNQEPVASGFVTNADFTAVVEHYHYVIGLANNWYDENYYAYIGQAGQPLVNSGTIDRTTDLLASPIDVAYDPVSGDLFIADNVSYTVRRVRYSGEIGNSAYQMEMIAGEPFQSGDADGTNASIRLQEMTGLTVLNNIVYVTQANGKMRVLSPTEDNPDEYSSLSLELVYDGEDNSHLNTLLQPVTASGKVFACGGAYRKPGEQVPGLGDVFMVQPGGYFDVSDNDSPCPGGIATDCETIAPYLDGCELIDSRQEVLAISDLDKTDIIVGLDGRVNNSLGETYTPLNTLTAGTAYDETTVSNWSGYSDFMEAYERQFQMVPEINALQVININDASANLPYLLDDHTLDAEDGEAFELVYVHFKPASCTDLCEVPVLENASNPDTICAEQKLALKAMFYEAEMVLRESTNEYTYEGEDFSLFDFVRAYYPLSIYQLSFLENEEDDLGDRNGDGLFDIDSYNDYQRLRTQYLSFDIAGCVSLITRDETGSAQGACDNCEKLYQYYVLGDYASLADGLTNFLDAWTEVCYRYPFGPDFYTYAWPAELTEFEDWVDPELINEPNSERIRPELIEQFGWELCNYIVTNFSAIKTEAKDFYQGHGPSGCGVSSFLHEDYRYYEKWKTRVDDNQFYECNFCEEDKHSDCGQPGEKIEVPQVDLALLPLRLEPVLAEMIAKRRDEYQTCVQVNNADFCEYVDQWWESFDPDNPDNEYQELYNDGEAREDLSGLSDEQRCEKLKAYYKRSVIEQKVGIALAARAATNLIHKESISDEIEAATADCENVQEFYVNVDKLVEFHMCRLGCELDREDRYRRWKEKRTLNLNDSLLQAYITNCFENTNDALLLSYDDRTVHYTLYFFDRADRLIATVPPEGVDFLDRGSLPKQHRMKTTYQYNSLNQLIGQETPDGGVSEFIYDNAGKLRFSQSAEQRQRSNDNGTLVYSYTKYDFNARVIESGELVQSNGKVWSDLHAYANLANYPDVDANTYMTASDRTKTLYDEAQEIAEAIPFIAQNTANRVAQTQNDWMKTYYSYDAHGRINAIAHQLSGIATDDAFKWTKYEYSPVQGRMEKVAFMKGKIKEDFYHRYTYDEQERIARVDISDNNKKWYTAAEYDYTLHGPLKTTKLAQNLQQLDYAYTANGWLKAINNPMEPANASNQQTDLFSQVMHYYRNDFGKSPFNTAILNRDNNNTQIALHTGDVYNGNISGITSNTQFSQANTASTEGNLLLQAYRYDWANRLNSSYTERYRSSVAPILLSDAEAPSVEYAVKLSYDGNGNITTLRRTYGQLNLFQFEATDLRRIGNEEDLLLDDLYYQYEGQGTNAHLNRLALVQDESTNRMANYFNGQSNFTYDASGRLTSDANANISAITWTAAGKVKTIQKTNNQSNLTFGYTPSQQRLFKEVSGDKTQYYIYGAGNKLMAVYEKDSKDKLTQVEIPVYGSERLGLYKPLIPESDGNGDVPIGLGLAPAVEGMINDMAADATQLRDQALQWVSDFAQSGLSASGEEVMVAAMEDYLRRQVAEELDVLALQVAAMQDMPAGYLQTEWQAATAGIAEEGLLSGNLADALLQAVNHELGVTPYTEPGQGIFTAVLAAIEAGGVTVNQNLILSSELLHDVDGELLAWENTNVPNADLASAMQAYAQFIRLGNANVGLSASLLGDYLNQQKNNALAAISDGQVMSWMSNLAGQNAKDVRQEVLQSLTSELSIAFANQQAEVNGSEWLNDEEAVVEMINGLEIQPISPAITSWALSGPAGINTLAAEAGMMAEKVSVAVLDRLGLDDLLDGNPPEHALAEPENLFIEIKDHLGNVRAVFAPNNVSDANDNTYRVSSLTDFYPFGSQMPGRSFSSDSYRYGFQGEEKDDEVKGVGNSINYKFRMHDTRLGRFFAVDPLAPDYPHNSPYAFSENRVVDGLELEGLEYGDINIYRNIYGEITKISEITTREIVGPAIGLAVHNFVETPGEEVPYKKVSEGITNIFQPPTINEFNKNIRDIDQAYINGLIAHIGYSSYKKNKNILSVSDLLEKPEDMAPNRNLGFSPKRFSGQVEVLSKEGVRRIDLTVIPGVLTTGAPFDNNIARNKRQIQAGFYELDEIMNRGELQSAIIRFTFPTEDGNLSNMGSSVQFRFNSIEDRTDFINTFLNEKQETELH